jgi:hypothetical protein
MTSKRVSAGRDPDRKGTGGVSQRGGDFLEVHCEGLAQREESGVRAQATL